MSPAKILELKTRLLKAQIRREHRAVQRVNKLNQGKYWIMSYTIGKEEGR